MWTIITSPVSKRKRMRCCNVVIWVVFKCASPQDNGVDTRAQTTQIVNGINNKIKLLRQYCPQLFQVNN